MTRGPGRRPGRSDTREAILAAARERFADVGFDKASIRSIAQHAGVDSALVHHYFGTKHELFIEVVALPVDPAVVLAPLRDSPLEVLGETIVRTLVGIWDSPAGVGALAAFRAVVAGGDESLLRTFLLEVALKGVRDRVDEEVGDGDMRVALVASQMVGVLVTRKLLKLEPVASMSVDDLAAHVGPTLQHYLSG
ncbi:TetR family transcriptional regulator [Gordonia sp. (in: high G+C Gram-positive bacteria)]|uniref:TetR/AcrR family transcriptional regulator n=1 Tax=Gordonia sp. (in: high G+C Gram-positive bacteria) TaxID=84139 RepID=UPI0039E530C1